MRTATTPAPVSSPASQSLNTSLWKGAIRTAGTVAGTAICLALAALAPTAARAHPHSPPVVIHVRDLAHYKLSYIERVEGAIQYQVNHQLHQIWHTPFIRFDPPSTRSGSAGSWLVDVTPRASVMYGFFTLANGFHLPQSPVYIEIAGRSKTQPMSLILSHEVIEALVDPWGNRLTRGVLTEVCDPVEQPGYLINGITVSDFVTPRWFDSSSVGGLLDFEGLLTRPLTVTPQGFMPRSMNT